MAADKSAVQRDSRATGCWILMPWMDLNPSWGVAARSVGILSDSLMGLLILDRLVGCHRASDRAFRSEDNVPL